MGWQDELQEHQNAEDERIEAHEATATNTWGPPGTFGCACQSRNSFSCAELRFGYRDQQEQCECLCHNWQDDGDDDLTPNAPDQARRQASPGAPGSAGPEACRDCGLLLAPWLRLYCTKCVQQHLTG